MRRIFIWVPLAIGWLTGQSQSDSLNLQTISRKHNTDFLLQQSRVKAFAQQTRQRIAFTDSLGNTIHLVGITPGGQPIYLTTLNANAAITTDVGQLRSGGSLGLNLLGEDMLVGVWDGGVAKDHVELSSRVIGKETQLVDNHATHVTGTLIATGINPAAKGMAPLGQALSFDFDNDEAEMAAQAETGMNSLLFSNHSYGTVTGWFKSGGVWQWTGDQGISPIEDYRFGFYDTRAQSIDQIAWLAPYYSIVWAAGNDRADIGTGSVPPDCNGGSGYDCIIPESVSKNIITVGAVNKVLSYTNSFDVTMSTFSSWGPTDDGRIKPDLVGDGVNVFSLSAVGTDTYTTLSGTSMSTPNVCGSLMVVQELYRKLHGGSPMKAATVKALAIHTAKEAGSFPGPDYSFGWGLLDAGAAGKILVSEDNQNVFVKELTLNSGGSFGLPLQPKVNQKITATIAWTDPPGNPVAPALDPANLMLVNDLDLRIVDDQGREQLPWSMDPSNPSRQALPGDNFRDNVEKLEFDFPEGKTYTLLVRHKGSLAGGKQDFSLIVSYQSTTPSKSFYWVGDSGSWSDGSHWSFTSGGPPAQAVPGSGDPVIVDENSFDGVGVDAIALTQDAACGSLIWLNSKSSGIGLNNHTLTVHSKCVLASDSLSILTPGFVNLLSSGISGELLMSNADLSGATLVFDGGWTIAGNGHADEIQFNSGTLKIESADLALNRLTATSMQLKQLDLIGSFVHLLQSSSAVGASFSANSQQSTLFIDGNVTADWQQVQFPAEIKITGGNTLTLTNGSNTFTKITDQGKLVLNLSNQVDTLVMTAGSEMDLGSGSIQTVSTAAWQGNAQQPVVISSPSNATIDFSEHLKLCFDFLTIINVNAQGPGVVNAGLNSQLTNASNWQQMSCDDVLFADFDVKYGCAGGMAEFTNKSSGQVTSYAWRFGSELTVINDTNPDHSFAVAGTYPVSLVATGPAGTDSVNRNIDIVSSGLTSNQVVSTGEVLTALHPATAYQWFKDGVALAGETERSYTLTGNGGVYFVVSYENACNVLSDSLTITEALDKELLEIFPNPASAVVKLKTGRPTAIGGLRITDFLGKVYMEFAIDQPEVTFSTASFPDGVYVLNGRVDGVVFRRKLIVLH